MLAGGLVHPMNHGRSFVYDPSWFRIKLSSNSTMQWSGGGHSQVTATSRPLKYNTKLYVGDARSCIPKSQQISNDFTDQITS